MVDVNSYEYKSIQAVQDYMEKEDMIPTPPISEWEGATVKKVIPDESYRVIDEAYYGSELYAVTIIEALAAPTFYIDPKTLQVIAMQPGE